MSMTYWFSEDALELDLGLLEAEGESLRSFLFRLWNPLLILCSKILKIAMFSTCVLYAENGRVLLQARESQYDLVSSMMEINKSFQKTPKIEIYLAPNDSLTNDSVARSKAASERKWRENSKLLRNNNKNKYSRNFSWNQLEFYFSDFYNNCTCFFANFRAWDWYSSIEDPNSNTFDIMNLETAAKFLQDLIVRQKIVI